MVKGRAQQAGFTVLEVLIGIGLFGLIMPSIILGVVSVSQLNDRAADLTRANVIAEQKFEELRSQGYNSLVAGGPPVDFSGDLDASFTQPRSAAYTVTSSTAGLKEIEIAISYTDRGTTRNLAYKTIMSELGVAQ